MDRFDGLFICTTNVVERLDRAALRRFAIKIGFDFLRPAQARALVSVALHRLGGEQRDDVALLSLGRLRQLAPGDVAAVVRRFLMLAQKPSVDAFIVALRDELMLKGEGAAQRIGF